MSSIWLVGAGPMARDYMKVLESLGCDYVTIGRGVQSAEDCRAHTSKPVIVGGLSKYMAQSPKVPSHAIVAVPVQELYNCTIDLINFGVKNILVEKPAGLNQQEILDLNQKCIGSNTTLLLAYNRRFYSSVIMAQKMIEEDGGCTSCVFEFTEWSHVIEKLDKPKDVFEHWFLGNSTHVVDLAFYLIGKPVKMSSFTQGATSWHSRSSAFSGAGISERNVLFSYHANWQAPGRWSVEVMTPKRRFIFKPMEELKVVLLGTVKEETVICDEQQLDKDFKPGLYKETRSFLEGDYKHHCTIGHQAQMMGAYYEIAGYS